MNPYTSSDFLMCFGTGAIQMESVQMDFSFFDVDVHYSLNAGKIIGFDCLIMLLEIASNTCMHSPELTMGRFKAIDILLLYLINLCMNSEPLSYTAHSEELLKKDTV